MSNTIYMIYQVNFTDGQYNSEMNKHAPMKKAENETPYNAFIERFSIGDGAMSVGVKDVIDIAGYPTRMGSKAFATTPLATKNALIIDRLLAGGADGGVQIIGKTNMHELAYGVTGLNNFYGTAENPHHPRIIPGGSSSGSAVAVAAGLCDAALGTDTGGSIRIPAACCGVIGLKPTYQRLPRTGLTPADSSLDCVGPFAKNAATLNAIMGMLDPAWDDVAKQGAARAFKLKWLETDANAEIENATYKMAGEMAGEMAGDLPKMRANNLDEAHKAGLTIIGYETYAAFGYLLGDKTLNGQLDAEVAARLARAVAINAADVAGAEIVRARFTREIDTLLNDCDALALPTLAGFAPLIEDAGDLQAMVDITRLCRPFNLSGHPAIALPLPSRKGRPISLQLVAAKGNDEALVALAYRFEEMLKTTPSLLSPSLEGGSLENHL